MKIKCMSLPSAHIRTRAKLAQPVRSSMKHVKKTQAKKKMSCSQDASGIIFRPSQNNISRSAWERHYCLGISFVSNFGILLRMRYPKTSVPAPSERHPIRFRSIASTYKWASVFMEAAADKYGSLWLAKRLRRWRWSLSTAFSGVGCAESASRPHAFETLITFC